MDQQSEHAFSSGEIFEPEAPEEDVMQKVLGSTWRRQNSEAWRLLLRAHDHVWKDHGWDWRTRFDVSALLWEKARRLLEQNVTGRAA